MHSPPFTSVSKTAYVSGSVQSDISRRSSVFTPVTVKSLSNVTNTGILGLSGSPVEQTGDILGETHLGIILGFVTDHPPGVGDAPESAGVVGDVVSPLLLILSALQLVGRLAYDSEKLLVAHFGNIDRSILRASTVSRLC